MSTANGTPLVARLAGTPATVPAVDIRGLSYAYAGGDQLALDDITLAAAPGERLGILGPNGGGKSTLLKLTLGLLRPQAGAIRIFGQSPDAARRAGMIGYVPQRHDIEIGFPVSARQAVMLGAAWRAPAWRPLARELRDRVEQMLELVGAAAYAEKAIGKLSGGQLQRVMIARALAARPRILALDEPTVGIDASGQAMFADLLARVHAELGLTILIISHDLRAIVAGSDRVACLARRLHSHVSPAGLTPQILAEVFSHDVAGWHGLPGAVHLHAHREDECDRPHDAAMHVHGPNCGHDPDAGTP